MSSSISGRAATNGAIRFNNRRPDSVSAKGRRRNNGPPSSPLEADDRRAHRRLPYAAGNVVAHRRVIFPEGQLMVDGCVQPIKDGYDLIARRAGGPVIMVHLDGLWGSIFSFAGGRWFFKGPRPGRRGVSVTVSAPLPASEVTPARLAGFWAEAEARAKVSPSARPLATVPA